MGAVAEGPIVAGNYAALGLDRDEIAGETRASFNLRRNQGVLGWNLRTEHGPRSGTSVSVALQIGLGRDPLAGRWHANATSVATQGAAAARVFLDHNGNGRRDPAEPPVEGAAFQVGTARTPERTGRDGTAFLPNLPENQLVALTLSPESLEDPLWVASSPGVSFVPRAGQVMMLDFPVRATGEIVGAVWLREAGATRPLPGVSVELVDAAGAVVKRARVAYDGWYELLAVHVSGARSTRQRGAASGFQQPGSHGHDPDRGHGHHRVGPRARPRFTRCDVGRRGVARNRRAAQGLRPPAPLRGRKRRGRVARASEKKAGGTAASSGAAPEHQQQAPPA
jgi:hypothetical protein